MTRSPQRTKDRGHPAAREPRGDTLLFLGPTLPASEVRLADTIVLPPVAVGDVLRATRRRGVMRIAIVDGYFERMAAVWHKEILFALERGIAVIGAASMGALRAAELAPFGMIGIGSIYQAYARGALVADDEVAVAHLPAEYGFRATSDALVNLRDGLVRAARAGVIDAPTRDRLIELARGRFYRERSWTQLVADGRAEGLALAALAAWPKPDRKAADARLLLRALAKPPVPPPKLRVPRTWAWRQLNRR